MAQQTKLIVPSANGGYLTNNANFLNNRKTFKVAVMKILRNEVTPEPEKYFRLDWTNEMFVIQELNEYTLDGKNLRLWKCGKEFNLTEKDVQKLRLHVEITDKKIKIEKQKKAIANEAKTIADPALRVFNAKYDPDGMEFRYFTTENPTETFAYARLTEDNSIEIRTRNCVAIIPRNMGKIEQKLAGSFVFRTIAGGEAQLAELRTQMATLNELVKDFLPMLSEKF